MFGQSDKIIVLSSVLDTRANIQVNYVYFTLLLVLLEMFYFYTI